MRYRALLGKLIARTAVHIGTGKGGDVTDDLCRRDVDGNYVIPGTAIGGALRTIATRLAPRLGSSSSPCYALIKQLSDTQKNKPCGCWVCHLFGDLNPGEDDSPGGASASRLFVAHAVAKLPDNISARIRDGVGISRITGASARAAAAKFDLEVLPKGTAFDLRLELEDRYDSEGKQETR